MAFRKRLFGPAVVVTGPTTLFTGQAGQSTTLTTLSISQPAVGTAKTVTLTIGADAAGTRFFQYSVPAGVGFYPIPVNHTLTGAEIITASVSADSGVAVLTGSGFTEISS